MTPVTDLGTAAVAAYAARQGADVATFLEGRGPALTLEQVGTAVVDLAGGSGRVAGAYQLTAAGLSPVK